MILYNMRYRGAFEYDKFVLNIFQISNEAKSLIKKFNSNEMNSIKELRALINEKYERLTQENNDSMKLLLVEHMLK